MVSIAFTGGGTGGHIYPGLAVASWLKKLFPCRIIWIGSGKGMDRAIVERAGIEFFGIPSGKLRRYFSLRTISDSFRVLAGFFTALRILKQERPGLLFSKGGFVSVPPCAAAKLLKIPVFTHDSDFSPGLATRINSRFAEKIFIPYKGSAAFFPGEAGKKLCVSGNPVRPEFAEADAAKGRAFLGLGEDERVLLVLGGSLGSREINILVRACLPELTRYYTVVHQTGDSSSPKEAAGEISSKAAGRYKPYAHFQDEIPHIIAAAELVLCRSGAGTIWECKYLHKPMVLVPLRGSGTRGDQVENSRLFEEAGAAVCFTGDDPEELSGLIVSLAGDPQRRRAMGEAKIVKSGDPSGLLGSGDPKSPESGAAGFIAEEIVRRIAGREHE